jgi:hypothetical protein
VVVLTLLAVPAAAQGPAGRWKTGIDTPEGRLPLMLELEVNGDKLTGTVSNDFLPKFPIENGAVKGNELTFTLRLQAVTLTYTGRLKGDELTLKAKVLEGVPPASPGQTLGDLLRGVDTLTAVRDR